MAFHEMCYMEALGSPFISTNSPSMNIVFHAMRANCIFIEKESAIEGSVFDCRASTGAVRR